LVLWGHKAVGTQVEVIEILEDERTVILQNIGISLINMVQ
jgi:hypothetical protein